LCVRVDHDARSAKALALIYVAVFSVRVGNEHLFDDCCETSDSCEAGIILVDHPAQGPFTVAQVRATVKALMQSLGRSRRSQVQLRGALSRTRSGSEATAALASPGGRTEPSGDPRGGALGERRVHPAHEVQLALGGAVSRCHRLETEFEDTEWRTPVLLFHRVEGIPSYSEEG
jgi:hypothetical protein